MDLSYHQPSRLALSTGFSASSSLNLSLPQDIKQSIRAEYAGTPAPAATAKPQTSSPPHDPWNGPDKKKHFIGSAILGCAAATYFDDPKTAFAVAMIPGTVKELVSYMKIDPRLGTGSLKDEVANAAGALTGVVTCHSLKKALQSDELPAGESSISQGYYRHLAEQQLSSPTTALVLPMGNRAFLAAISHRF